MLKILVAVDGSETSLRATEALAANLRWYREPPQITLLAVHLPVPQFGLMHNIVSQEMIESYYNEECDAMLAPSRKVLDAAGIAYAAQHRSGAVAETIVDEANRLGCDMIYMGTRGMTALSNMMLGSTTTKLLHLTHVPVVLVR